MNVQSDVILMSVEEPRWLFSESMSPLSSAFVHHALLFDFALASNGLENDALFSTAPTSVIQKIDR